MDNLWRNNGKHHRGACFMWSNQKLKKMYQVIADISNSWHESRTETLATFDNEQDAVKFKIECEKEIENNPDAYYNRWDIFFRTEEVKVNIPASAESAIDDMMNFMYEFRS